MNGLHILCTGPLSLVQDLGRVGHLRSGVGVSGAADRGALRLANRLVGNREGAAGIEVLIGGLELVADRTLTVAVTGAPAQAYVNGTPVGRACTVVVAAGAILRLGYADSGLRCYLAVRGGVAVDPVLGSRSTDTLSGIGPEPLRAGDVVPVGSERGEDPAVDFAPVPAPQRDTVTVGVRFGPRENYFTEPDSLTVGEWVVSADSDRVGLRLERPGPWPLLQRSDARELPTEGMVTGAVQVPPSGLPVVFLADHPITGGYPVVGVVCDNDLDALAQLRPGAHLRFFRRTGS